MSTQIIQDHFIDIVVAEDDPDDQLLIEKAFKAHALPHQIYYVGNGQELLDFLYRKNSFAYYAGTSLPKLIILDLNMPKMDGREALDIIKADKNLKHIPITVFTTSKQEEDVLRSYYSGANTFITKPLNMEGYIDIIKGIDMLWSKLYNRPSSRKISQSS